MKLIMAFEAALAYYLKGIHWVMIGIGVLVVLGLLVAARVALTRRHASRHAPPRQPR
ncbi:hypothetical protein [Actinomadura parmotrematis]|uniref:LPXTG cell wall anchor domain-containing protein n=1 Tax=Actinomadura parmotrematis TaxID=2864039 RepID=A0ABS7G0E2_9ACTN|nr:hypothetical protein [Actinomadura parmotrematis]MBW8485123.1 hypothetical protein [Actinomadura parmotrematis]